MGDLSFSDMQTELRIALGNPSTVSMSDTRLRIYLNWAYGHICRPFIHRHREMRVSTTFTLTLSNRYYRLETDIGVTNFYSMSSLINDTQGMRLIPLDIRRQEEQPILPGLPAWYDLDYTTATEEPQIIVFPTVGSDAAGDTMRLRYWRSPELLQADGDHTVLPPDWDEVILVGALWRAWRARRAYERAEMMKGEFAQSLNEIGDRLVADLQDKDWETGVELVRHQEGT